MRHIWSSFFWESMFLRYSSASAGRCNFPPKTPVIAGKKSATSDIPHGRRWRKWWLVLYEAKVKGAIERALGEIKNRLLENVEPYACQHVEFRKYRN
jgi:hypothetical protein